MNRVLVSTIAVIVAILAVSGLVVWFVVGHDSDSSDGQSTETSSTSAAVSTAASTTTSLPSEPVVVTTTTGSEDAFSSIAMQLNTYRAVATPTPEAFSPLPKNTPDPKQLIDSLERWVSEYYHLGPGDFKTSASTTDKQVLNHFSPTILQTCMANGCVLDGVVLTDPTTHEPTINVFANGDASVLNIQVAVTITVTMKGIDPQTFTMIPPASPVTNWEYRGKTWVLTQFTA